MYPLQKFEKEAINALVSLPIDDDTISRKAAIEAVEFGITYAKAINKETGEVTVLFEESNAELQEAADRIKQLPPAQPEKRTEERTETHACDSISRQAAIDIVKGIDSHFVKYVEQLPPTNTSEYPNSSDTISRKEAIEAADAIIARDKSGNNAVVNAMIAWREYIKHLQPEQPESDPGRWERHYSRPGVYADLCWHCSKCGYKTDYQYANVNHHYCPNCGRKMEREVSDE